MFHFRNLSSTINNSHTQKKQSHTDRTLIDKRQLTHVHAYTHTQYWDTYIISLGGQPEPTQSFNFYDSLREREKKPSQWKLRGWDKKDKHCLITFGHSYFTFFVLLLEPSDVWICRKNLSHRPQSLPNHVWVFWITDTVDPKHYTRINRQQMAKKSGMNRQNIQHRSVTASAWIHGSFSLGCS